MRNGTATAHSAKDVQKELRALKAKLADLADSIQEDASDAASTLLEDGPKLAKAYGEDLLESALSGAKGLGDVAAKQVMSQTRSVLSEPSLP